MDDFNTTLEQAVKKRILEEIARRSEGQVINNFQGGGAPLASESRQANSLQESMFDPGAFDYFVNIKKTPFIDPETGLEGWNKSVQRSREEKKQEKKKAKAQAQANLEF